MNNLQCNDMINKILNFIFALILTSFVLFILFDKIIMPTYIRKDKTITVMDLKGKNLDLAIKQKNDFAKNVDVSLVWGVPGGLREIRQYFGLRMLQGTMGHSGGHPNIATQ